MKIDTIKFSGMRLIGRIFIDWENNHIKRLIMSQEDTSWRIKAEQFRTLKQNFNTAGNIMMRIKHMLSLKGWNQKPFLKEGIRRKKISAVWKYPSYVFKLIVFDMMGIMLPILFVL